MTPCNPVCWFEIYVQDLDRARQFYETVLDRKLERIRVGGLEMYVFRTHQDRVGSGGALVKLSGVRSGTNSTIVYFVCEDCSIEAARIEQAGGRIVRERMSIGDHGHVVLALDPEGNMVGLHSMG